MAVLFGERYFHLIPSALPRTIPCILNLSTMIILIYKKPGARPGGYDIWDIENQIDPACDVLPRRGQWAPGQGALEDVGDRFQVALVAGPDIPAQVGCPDLQLVAMVPHGCIDQVCCG